MRRSRHLFIPPDLERRVLEMPPRGYCRRMYFGPNRLLNAWHLHGLRQSLRLVEIDAQDRVLDLGCADGMLMMSLDHYAGFSVGVDIYAPFLGWARRLSPGLRFMRACASALPFDPHSFTKVFCLEVLEHVEEPARAVAEIARVLEPGGAAVVSVPIEVGPALLLKQAAAWLSGYRRDESYTWRQLARSALGRPPEHPREGGHFGFDFRAVETMLREHMRIARRRFLPCPALGSLANVRVVYVGIKT